MNTRRIIPLSVVVCALAGCTTLRTPTQTQTQDNFPSAALETAYQLASAVDYSTTVNLARRPDCYHESIFPTRQFLGEHPSVTGVEAYWAASSVAHYEVSRWLDREVDATDSDGWRAARWAWHIATIAVSVRADISNYRIGLRPFGARAASRCQP